MSTRQPDVDGVPLPVCVHLDGTVTRVHTHGCPVLPGPWATLKMPGRAFHCPLDGPVSQRWVDRHPGARSWAGCTLGLGQAPSFSSERQAIPDAGHLQTRRTGIGPPAQERKWRRGRPRTGSGKAAEGGSGRKAWGGRVIVPAPSSGGRASLPRRSACVCTCVCLCAHAPACQARAPEPHTREPEHAVSPTPGTRRGLGAGFDETA